MLREGCGRLLRAICREDFQPAAVGILDEVDAHALVLFFSLRDHQSLSQSLADCKKLFVSHEKSQNMKRTDHRDI